MNYVLKDYQKKAVKAVANRIAESEMIDTLNDLASNPADMDLKAKANRSHGVQIKAPTGSGKTIIIGSLIKEHLQDFVVLVFSPGAGNLEEQTAKKLEAITGSTQVIASQTFNFAPVSGVNYVSNWEALVSMSKGTNAYITKLSKDSENNNIFDWLGKLSVSKTPVAIIIDESHHGSAKSTGSILAFLDDIRRTLGYSPFMIEASATPILRDGAAEGLISIEPSEVVKVGLLRKAVKLNSGASKLIAEMTAAQRANTDLEKVIFDVAFKKLQEIDKEYVRIGSNYHGLMAIQLPSSVAGKEAIERIKEFFRPLGLTVENGQIALFMNGAKEGDMDIIHTPESPVRVLLYKQGISMGWDCPRAQVLVGLRHLTSKVFTVQNLGRFIRTTEAKHYNNDILDKAYVYSNAGDMGSKNYEKDVDHTLPYEGEVSLKRANGRYTLQSINDLQLDLTTFVRKSQNPLDRKTFQRVWIEKVNAYRLWEKLQCVDTREVSEALNETEKKIIDVLEQTDSDGIEEESEGVGINHMVQWKELESKIIEVSKKNGRDFGNNARIAQITMPAIMRWATQAMMNPVSDKPEQAHWGTMATVYETAIEGLPKEAKGHIDLNAFITEYVLDKINFAHVASVLDDVFSAKEISPVAEIDPDGEQVATRNSREKVSLGKYVLPHTLAVVQTIEHEVDARHVPNYAFTQKESYGDGTIATRAFRQEGELSGPEKAFEEYLNGAEFFRDNDIEVSYFKNGTKQKDNYSIAVSNDSKEANFYPDYLFEMRISSLGVVSYTPGAFEVKDKIEDNMDTLVLEKAASLIALSKENNIPAGVVFPKKTSGFSIITAVDVKTGKFFTSDLDEYLNKGSWKKFD